MNSNCKACQKYELKSKLLVSFPLAKNFSETVALDLREWEK